MRFIVEKVEASDGVSGYVAVKNNKFADDLGISSEQINRDIETYGDSRVNFALEYTKKQIDLGKVISNVVAFYKVALRENWSEQVTSSVVKKTQLDKNILEMEGSINFINFIGSLRKRVGDEIFCSWFLDIGFVAEDSDKIILRTSSTFKRDYILENFINEIKSVVSAVIGNKDVRIIL